MAYFHESAVQLRFLDAPPDEHMLRDYPLAVRRVMVREVSTFLLEESSGAAVATPAHLRWAMEVVGQGFSLPVEDEGLIQATIELYRRWSVTPGKQPSAFHQEEQYFLQRTFMHSSLMFMPRSTPDVGRLQAMCTAVLNLYTQLIRDVGTHFSLQTWDVVLKLLLAVTDSLLRSGEELGRRLAPLMVKVVFEAWLRSHTQSRPMWDRLSKLITGWLHHPATVVDWNVITLALTKRMLALLYGAKTADRVTIQTDDIVEFDLPADLVYYNWLRFIQLIRDPNDLQDPKIFATAMSGIESVLKQFVRVFNERERSGQPVTISGNAVLHVFGGWLFSAVKKNRPGFDEGTAAALRSLCSIFQTLHGTEFEPNYLAQFYDCLQEVLLRDPCLVQVAAIINGGTLLSLEFPSFFVNYPYFLDAARRLLARSPNDLSVLTHAETLRGGAFRVLLCLIGLPAQYSSVAFRISSRASVANLPKIPRDMRPIIGQVLLDALQKETAASNLMLVMGLLAAHLHEDPEPVRIASVCHIVVNKLAARDWNREVSLYALSTLTALASHSSRLERPAEKAAHLTSSLARFINSMLTAAHDDEKQEMLVLALRCISDWVMAWQWIHLPESGDCGSVLADSLIQLIDDARRRPGALQPMAPVREHAEMCLACLQEYSGELPAVCGMERVSCDFNEEEELALLHAECKRLHAEGHLDHEPPADPRAYLRFFYSAEPLMLITVIDRPQHVKTSAHTVLMVVRSVRGRHVYVMEQSQLPLTEVITYPSLYDGRKGEAVHPHEPPFPRRTDDFHAGLLDYLGNPTSALKYDPAMLQVSQSVRQLEVEHSQAQNYGLDDPCTIDVPPFADGYMGESKVPVGRQLLANLGVYGPLGLGSFAPLSIGSAGFQRHLSLLDDEPERDLVLTAIAFVGHAGTSGAGAKATRDFWEVVCQLGTELQPPLGRSRHMQIAGSRDADLVLSWCSHRTESVVHVFSQPETQLTAARVADYRVAIIWVHSTQAYDQFVAPKSQGIPAFVHIVVRALTSGLFQVRFYRRPDKLFTPGPLIDGIVLDKRTLGTLLRQTLLSAHRACDAFDPASRPSQHSRRLALLEQINSFVAHSLSPARVLGCMFGPPVEFTQASGPAGMSTLTRAGVKGAASNVAARLQAGLGAGATPTMATSATAIPSLSSSVSPSPLSPAPPAGARPGLGNSWGTSSSGHSSAPGLPHTADARLGGGLPPAGSTLNSLAARKAPAPGGVRAPGGFGGHRQAPTPGNVSPAGSSPARSTAEGSSPPPSQTSPRSATVSAGSSRVPGAQATVPAHLRMVPVGPSSGATPADGSATAAPAAVASTPSPATPVAATTAAPVVAAADSPVSVAARTSGASPSDSPALARALEKAAAARKAAAATQIRVQTLLDTNQRPAEDGGAAAPLASPVGAAPASPVAAAGVAKPAAPAAGATTAKVPGAKLMVKKAAPKPGV